MNVLKVVIVSFIVCKLFSFDLYTPDNFEKKPIKNLKYVNYKNIKDVDFNKSLAVVSYNEIPLIFKKNLIILTPIGEVREYILTYKKSLSDIKAIANIDFASKILLDKVNKDYKIVKGNINDFLNRKLDAIVYSKRFKRKDIYNFPLKKYGIELNKFFIVTTKEFLDKHKNDIEKLNESFEETFDFRKDLAYKTLLLSSLYLNKKINFDKVLFENYHLKEDEKVLRVDVTANWPPFDIYENKKLYGIGVDFWKLIAKKAHLNYKFNIKYDWLDVLKDIKEKKTDLTINTSATPDREKFSIFSKPYLSFPLAVICRNDEVIKSIKDIKSIAVGKNFTAEKLMKKYYPNLNYVETKDVFEALNLVRNKKAQCAVDILPTILWTINKNHLMNLQIAFKTPFKFNVQIMIRKDKKDLLQKINKAISAITPQEREEILNRYLNTIVIERNNNKKSIAWILFIVLIVFFLLILWFKKRFKKIKSEALYDELTQIYNRKGVLEELKEVKRGSVLFFDLDHFKKINDTYGHEFGDYVLSEIGNILKSNFRESDIIGRWGGEEFVVILPNTKYKDALKLAEKLRKIIENYDFDGKKVTISIGVSAYNGNLEASLAKADMALYEAKKSGRNQVKGML